MTTKNAWTPPTPTPEAGQGPWCNNDQSMWWVVAEHPDEAVADLRRTDAEIFPDYYGWWLTCRRVSICWVDPADWDEENEIVRCLSDADGAAEAWEIEVQNA